MKSKNLLIICTTLMIALFFGCKKDNFTETIGLCPKVIYTDPASGSNNVPLNKVVRVTFNKAMDPSTINQSSFALYNGTTQVSGSLTYNEANNTITFTPDDPLTFRLSKITATNEYTGKVSASIKDKMGNNMLEDYVWNFSTGTNGSPSAIQLKTVDSFGIISGTGVHNNAGPSQIVNMDVGIYPGFRTSITGFPPATIINGAIYAADDIAPPGVAAMLSQAKQDLVDAYDTARLKTFPAPATVSGDQGGLTLKPGIYKTASTLLIQSGDLTLDARGDINAVWIFQIGSDFTTVGGAGGNIILTGGAQAKNIYWQVGGSAVIGDFTSFQGNVLALTSITMNSSATAVGRMLAINGAVTMTSTNIITKP